MFVCLSLPPICNESHQNNLITKTQEEQFGEVCMPHIACTILFLLGKIASMHPNGCSFILVCPSWGRLNEIVLENKWQLNSASLPEALYLYILTSTRLKKQRKSPSLKDSFSTHPSLYSFLNSLHLMFLFFTHIGHVWVCMRRGMHTASPLWFIVNAQPKKLNSSHIVLTHVQTYFKIW